MTPGADIRESVRGLLAAALFSGIAIALGVDVRLTLGLTGGRTRGFGGNTIGR
jgi:hypothetical protein